MPSQVLGERELRLALEKLPSRMAQRALDSATRAGAQVLRKGAAAQAGTGRQNVVIRKKRGTVRGKAAYFVGNAARAFWLFFQEFGVTAHPIRVRDAKALVDAEGAVFGRSVAHPGHGPRPWLRPALVKYKGAVLKKMAEQLRRALAREVQKLRTEPARLLRRAISGVGSARRAL